MESKGIDRLFPRAAAYIYHPDKMSLSLKKTSLDSTYITFYYIPAQSYYTNTNIKAVQ